MRPRNSLTVVVVGLMLACTASAGSAVAGRSRSAASGLPVVATSPSWSPDGKQVLFSYVRYAQTSCCGLQPSHYRIVRRSSRPGGAIRTIHAGRDYSIPVEPLFWVSRRRIVFGANGPWYSIGVHGGKPKPIVFPTFSCNECGPSAAILTPNRKYAAASILEGDPHFPDTIALLKLKPGDPVVIPTPLTAEENGSITDDVLAFSPKGGQLVFRRTPWDPSLGYTGPSVVMAIRLGGGDPVPLAQSGIPGASLVPSDASEVQWSSDGRRVAFLQGLSLEVASTTGTGAPRVVASCPSSQTFGLGFSWSPTSKWIAYDCVPEDNSGQVSTVRPDGTHRTHLLRQFAGVPGGPNGFAGYTGPSEGEPLPQWSPNGSRLLLLAAGSVWTIRPNGHDLHRIG